MFYNKSTIRFPGDCCYGPCFGAGVSGRRAYNFIAAAAGNQNMQIQICRRYIFRNVSFFRCRNFALDNLWHRHKLDACHHCKRHISMPGNNRYYSQVQVSSIIPALWQSGIKLKYQFSRGQSLQQKQRLISAYPSSRLSVS